MPVTSVTAKGLIKHGRKFGPEGLIETYAEYHPTVDSMAKFIEEVDAIAITWAKANRKLAPSRPRLSYETRAQRALGLEEDAEEKS